MNFCGISVEFGQDSLVFERKIRKTKEIPWRNIIGIGFVKNASALSTSASLNRLDASKEETQNICLLFATTKIKKIVGSGTKDLVETIRQKIYSRWINDDRQILFLMNPFGGTKKAPKVWERLQAVLDICGVNYAMEETKRRGHAAEIAKGLDFGKTRMIVCLSGDGLLHEVMNGLTERLDWAEIKEKLSLGVIPCGSGNAVAESIGIKNIPQSVAVALQAHSIAANVMRVTLGDRKLISLVGFLWALIADIDIESERFRSLGSARFTLQAIVRALSLRRYRAKLSYTTESGDWSKVTAETIPETWSTTGLTTFTYFIAMNVSHCARDFCVDPNQNFQSNAVTLQYLNDTNSAKILSLLTAVEKADHITHVSFNKHVQAFFLEPITEDAEMDSSWKNKGRYSPEGIVSIDGEAFPVSACLVESLHAAIHFIVPFS